jgi:Sulfotransferase domain
MKVFCIGLNKTGTRSLHLALERLGLRSLHWGGPARGPQIRALVEQSAREGRPLLEDIDDVDAYSDILALSTRFDLLDGQYPGSRFILTTRDLDAWLDSRRRHVEENLARQASGDYAGTFVTVDLDAWTREMEDHVARVRAHFAGRPDDLLVMDISAGDGWEQLCPFLGLPVPEDPFPPRG